MMIVLVVIAVSAVVAYVWYAGIVNVRTARKRVRRGALFLDVDAPEDYERSHLPGAVNIPVEDLPLRQKDIGPPTRSIVVYARRDMRSAHAAHLLRVLGYRSVVSLGDM